MLGKSKDQRRGEMESGSKLCYQYVIIEYGVVIMGDKNYYVKISLYQNKENECCMKINDLISIPLKKKDFKFLSQFFTPTKVNKEKIIVYFIDDLSEFNYKFLELTDLKLNNFILKNKESIDFRDLNKEKLEFSIEEDCAVYRIITNQKIIRDYFKKISTFDKTYLMIWCVNKFKYGGELKVD